LAGIHPTALDLPAPFDEAGAPEGGLPDHHPGGEIHPVAVADREDHPVVGDEHHLRVPGIYPGLGAAPLLRHERHQMDSAHVEHLLVRHTVTLGPVVPPDHEVGRIDGRGGRHNGRLDDRVLARAAQHDHDQREHDSHEEETDDEIPIAEVVRNIVAVLVPERLRGADGSRRRSRDLSGHLVSPF
jgi:hypothetical protein